MPYSDSVPDAPDNHPSHPVVGQLGGQDCDESTHGRDSEHSNLILDQDTQTEGGIELSFNDTRKSSFAQNDTSQPASREPQTSSSQSVKDGLEPTFKPSKSRTLYQDWQWELITWALSTVALAITFVLLAIFRGRPLSDWQSKVSLTAMLSILSQTSQSMLLVSLGSCIGQLKWNWFRTPRKVDQFERFDKASRGPEGSLTLLWHHLFTLRTLHLVSLGALMTVLIVVLPPFVQQSVNFDRVRNRTLDNDAAIPQYFNFKAESAIAGSGNYGGMNRSQTGSFTVLTETAISAGVAAGMVSSDTTLSSLPAQCSTGNCTFEPYSTLGMCATAMEASSMIRESNCTLPFENAPVTTCDINILPNITYSNAPPFKPPPPLREAIGVEKPRFWTGHEYNGNGTLDVYVIYERMPWLSEGLPTGKKQNWLAAKGSIQPCVLTLQTEVINGRTNTTVLGSHPVRSERCVQVSGQTFCTDLDDNASSFSRFMGILANAFVNTANVYQQGDNYFMGPYAQFLFVDIFGTGVYDLPSEGELITRDPIPGLQGFAKRLDILTASITNAFRASINARDFKGKTQINEPMISVELYWLIVPVFLWSLSTAFLFATIFTTYSSGTPVWKSSALVTLYSFDENTNIPSAKELVRDLEQKNQKVILWRKERSWRLAKL